MPGTQTDTERERERVYVYLQFCPTFFLSLSGIVVVVVAVCSTAFCSRGVTTTMLAELLQQNEELPTLKRDPSFIVLC
jgi:hypothetical protein